MELVSLDLLDGRFDIICLSESWLHNRVDDAMVDHDQYKLIRQDRQIDSSYKTKRGGGLCVYVKRNIDVQFMTDDPANCCDAKLELLHFKVLPKNQKKIDVCVIYRPPSGSISACITTIKESIDKIGLNHVRDELVLLGDLNIDMINGSVLNRNKVCELGRALNVTQIIKDPTRITKKSSTLIDLCFTNIRHVANSGTIMWNASDHLPIFLVKKKVNPEQEKTSPGEVVC